MTTRLATHCCKNVQRHRYIARQGNKCACWCRVSQLWVSVLHLVANFKTVELLNNTRKKGTSAFPPGHVSVLQHETPAAELTRGTQTDGGEHHQAVSYCLPHTHTLWVKLTTNTQVNANILLQTGVKDTGLGGCYKQARFTFCGTAGDLLYTKVSFSWYIFKHNATIILYSPSNEPCKTMIYNAISFFRLIA